MSEEHGREGASRRSSSRKSLSETTLPQEYLDKLEEKRKQLDDSIHRYIAQKEREYKQFSKELKLQHKLSQGQDGHNDGAGHRGSPNGAQDSGRALSLEAQRISAVDTLQSMAEAGNGNNSSPDSRVEIHGPQDRSVIAGLKDRRASIERDKDFLGLFTPDYLPALNAQEPAHTIRPTSAPNMLRSLDAQPPASPPDTERANSDSILQGKLKRPIELAFMQRTSSSGSSADGRLASALKSPSHRSRQKRVSLAVGDEIVAPSDSVPTALTHRTTSSHSRKRSSLPEREYPVSTNKPTIEDETAEPKVEGSPPRLNSEDLTNATIDKTETGHPSSSNAPKLSPSISPKMSPKSRIDPDGDLFDLEAEEYEDMPPAELESDESDNILESDEDMSDRVEPIQHENSPPSTSRDVRYDSTTGLIPEPAEKDEDSAVPYLAFGPSSAVAPTEPGFRRPSVVHDPIYMGKNYKAVEQDAVENDIYGSSANRPASKGSFTAGSLGESYMAQHAEEMMRARNARQQAQVKS